jgi:hypothetical protein
MTHPASTPAVAQPDVVMSTADASCENTMQAVIAKVTLHACAIETPLSGTLIDPHTELSKFLLDCEIKKFYQPRPNAHVCMKGM